jgi:hypothetical protein
MAQSGTFHQLFPKPPTFTEKDLADLTGKVHENPE